MTRVKCLLVDDISENLIALSAILERDDVELLTAKSGQEALELLLIHEVALAFIDVQMPEIDGFTLAEFMRSSERTRHVPIIFVTAGAHDWTRMFKGYETGAVDFLFKPLVPHIIQSKADVFFRLHRQTRQLAQELHERSETLRLNEMLTAVLGHDLRNPLSAILGAASLLARRSEDETVRKSTGIMLSSGKRMNRMIDDMLDLARARLAGGIPVRRVTGDLADVVQKTVDEHRAAAAGRVIQLESRGDLVGQWDLDRLAQATSNLLANAQQHGAETGPISIALDGTQAALVTVTISNPGPIPSDVLPHLFDPFRRRKGTSGDDGLGLGLYIVQQIAQAHAGRVDVDSDSLAAKFTLTLPRTALAADASFRAERRPASQ